MILHKFWSAFVAQINKVANLFWEADPVAQMRYEYDRAVEQLKEGRTGLEQYRGLVERVTRQVSANRSHVQKLEAETKAYLKAGDRTTAAKFALELQKAKEEMARNWAAPEHESGVRPHLSNIQHANGSDRASSGFEVRDGEMSAAGRDRPGSRRLRCNLTTDSGSQSVIQPRFDQSRGKGAVAADLSKDALQINSRTAAEGARRRAANSGRLGLRSPETTRRAPRRTWDRDGES